MRSCNEGSSAFSIPRFLFELVPATSGLAKGLDLAPVHTNLYTWLAAERPKPLQHYYRFTRNVCLCGGNRCPE